MAELKCEWSTDDFDAYLHVVLGGDGPFVVVTGKGRCPTTGYAVHLEEIGRDDDTVRVRIVEDPPNGLVHQTVSDTAITEFRTIAEARFVDIEGVGTIRVSWPSD